MLGHEGAGIISAVGDGVTDRGRGRPRDRGLVAAVRALRATAPPATRRTCAARSSSAAAMQPRFMRGRQAVVRHGRHRHVRRVHDAAAEAAIKIADDMPVRDRLAHRLRRHHRRRRRHQHREGDARAPRSWCSAAAASGIAAIQGARIAGAAEIVAVDLVDDEARAGQDVRRHPRLQARRARRAQGRAHRRRLRLRLRGHRPARHHAGGLRRRPPRRHGLHHRRRRRWTSRCRSTPSSCSSPRRASRAATTARPTCAATSTGCSGSGRPASSTSRA